MGRWYFLRHGEAEHNVGFIHDGVSAYKDPKYKDARLTERGRDQARTVGRNLKTTQINVIFTSPLRRCIETAHIVRESLGSDVRIIVMHGLIEKQGDHEICNEPSDPKTLQDDYPSIEIVYQTPNEYTTCMTHMPRETASHVKARMMSCLEYGSRYFDDKHILWVSHHDTLADTFSRFLQNCEWFQLTHFGGKMLL